VFYLSRGSAEVERADVRDIKVGKEEKEGRTFVVIIASRGDFVV
jgi:hypothetical protein